MEDIKLDNLIINKLTKAQYDSAEKSENELYVITDEEFYTKSEVEQFVKENINCFTITEDMVTVEKDATKGTAPYSTAYGYTNITINDNSIIWKEGAIYVFVVNTAMAVNSAYRNVRVRIGEDGDWKPMMDTSSIMSGSTYMVMGINTNFQYKTVYQSTGALHRQTDTNTTYTLNQLMNQSIYVSGIGSYAISRYSICMQKPDLTWEKLTNTSQEYSQATTKTANTSGFLLNLRYYNTTADLGNGSKTAVNTMCSQYYDVQLNYSTNCGTKHNQEIGTPVFIVGSIGEDGLFYLDTEQWWSYALPTTNDGKLYIYIGTTINTIDSKISFEVYKPIYYHNGTKICEYKVADNKQNATDNALTTTDKTIVGAINELNSSLGDISTALDNIISG